MTQLSKGTTDAACCDHRGENVVEIECGSNFLRNFQERVEGVDFALGIEHVGVVQSYGGLLADGGKEEEVVLVERSAV